MGKYDEVCKLGFDLWQVKSGTIFDNVLITDDVAEAKKIGDETWGATKDPEKAMKDSQDEEEKAKAEAEVNKSFLFLIYNFFFHKLRHLNSTDPINTPTFLR